MTFFFKTLDLQLIEFGCATRCEWTPYIVYIVIILLIYGSNRNVPYGPTVPLHGLELGGRYLTLFVWLLSFHLYGVQVVEDCGSD